MRIVKSIYIIMSIIGLVVSFPIQAANPFPFVLPWNDTLPGGITDFQALNHKPAGQYGPISVRADGHLTLGNSPTASRVRFLGVNVTGTECFPTHANAEIAAKRMAKFGINLVRCMNNFNDTNVFDSDVGVSGLDAVALERLDYFVNQLKQQGIYFNLHLLTGGRIFMAADVASVDAQAALDEILWDSPYYARYEIVNIIAMYNAELIQLQKNFANALLSRVNTSTANTPTPLTYLNDPAVAFVEINNENGLIFQWRRDMFPYVPQFYRDDLQQQWNAWLRNRYGTTAALQASWGSGQALGNEILLNPNFVDEYKYGGNWSVLFSPPVAGTFGELRTDDVPVEVNVSGARSLHLTQTSNGGLTLAQCTYSSEPNCSANASTMPDKPYTVSFWAKADTTSTAQATVTLRMNTLSSWTALGLAETVTLTNTWKQFTFTFWTSPATSNAVNPHLVFENMSLETPGFWYAGISLKPGGVLNESLEAGTIPLFSTQKIFLARSLAAQRDWLSFLRDTEDAYYQTMRTYIKNTLGSKALVIGTQSPLGPLNVMAKLDAIDTHAYWQHPSFGANGAWTVLNQSMVNERGGVLPDIGLTRVLNKPFTVSEYNHPAPNTYGSEAYLMLASYAALQDWDAIYAYVWGVHGDTGTPGMFPSWFEINQHPNKMATMLAAAAMFRRGDVSAATQEVVVPINLQQEIDYLMQANTSPCGYCISAVQAGVPREAMLVHRVAVAAQGQTVPAGALTPTDVASLGNVNTKTFVSDTGQLNWDVSQTTGGVLTINSPKSKGVIGFGGGKTFNLSGVVIEPGAGLQSGWSTVTLTSVEGGFTPTTSNRLLITATGYTQNTNMVWSNADKSSVSNWGIAPTLVEGVSARITLPLRALGVEAWTLGEAGLRLTSLPVQTNTIGNAVINIGPARQTLWYEVKSSADLIPTALTASLSGGNLLINDSVKNQGAAPAGPFTISFYLSKDKSYQAGTDYFICSRTVNSLGVGAQDPSSGTKTTTCAVPSTAPAGKYYVIVVDDASNNMVSESSETNNTKVTSGTITK